MKSVIYKTMIPREQLIHTKVTLIPCDGPAVKMLDAEVNPDDHCAVDVWYEFEDNDTITDAFEVLCLWTGNVFEAGEGEGWEHLRTLYGHNGLVHHLYARRAR